MNSVACAGCKSRIIQGSRADSYTKGLPSKTPGMAVLRRLSHRVPGPQPYVPWDSAWRLHFESIRWLHECTSLRNFEGYTETKAARLPAGVVDEDEEELGRNTFGLHTLAEGSTRCYVPHLVRLETMGFEAISGASGPNAAPLCTAQRGSEKPSLNRLEAFGRRLGLIVTSWNPGLEPCVSKNIPLEEEPASRIGQAFLQVWVAWLARRPVLIRSLSKV